MSDGSKQASLRAGCPECGVRFTVREDYASKKIKCPSKSCDAKFTLPSLDELKTSAAKAAESTASEKPNVPSGAKPSPSGRPTPKAAKLPAPKPRPSGKPSARAKSPALAPLPGATQPLATTVGRSKKSSAKLPTKAIAAVAVLLVAAGGAVVSLRPAAEPETTEAAPIARLPVAEETPDEFEVSVRPFFQKHCLDCHGTESPEGDLDLATDLLDGTLAASKITENRHVWEHAYNMIRIGAMPPADMDTPEVAEKDAVTAWLDNTLYHVDCEANPSPGRVTARRLNRAEYNNTVRDLFGVEVRPAKDFPSDEVGYGFDNIGDVLSMPPLLVEKYLDAAEEVAQAAIATGDPDLESQGRAGDQLRLRKASVVGGMLNLGTTGASAAWENVHFKRDGEYKVRIMLGADQIKGEDRTAVSIQLGDETLEEWYPIDTETSQQTVLWERTLYRKASRQPLRVTMLNDLYRPKGRNAGDRNAHLHSIEVIGPYGVAADATPSRLVAVRPGQTVDGKELSVAEAAAANLEELLPRAFRRPVPPAEVDSIARFCALTVEQGGSFEEGMQACVQAILVSPRFLFRIESDDGSYGRIARQLDDYELASRLSYFLWTTMPDDELFAKAEEGTLSQPDVLRGQVARMLADERADEMLTSFAGQWLGLRQLPEQSIDPESFPKFDPRLLDDMAGESEHLVRHVVRENRPVAELLTADYTFVNERLAQHYGIPDIAGYHFRRVDLSAIGPNGGSRRGLLTHASVLTLTSYPNRTSPVRRGEWILSNILGDEPPPPPPNVPALDETQASSPDLPLRAQLELHRADPTCASCHVVMDELGFGFENFDAVGRYRTKDGKHDVDAAGVLPGGKSFNGAMELISVLEDRETEFVHTFIERLLTFALGRGIDYRDKCIIDEIVHSTAGGEHRAQEVIRAIVLSDAFREQGPDPNLYAAR